ncbi:hypothetical protein CHS0354_026135 [Potamilus streckersoni]|uniref:Novel STAND NTPase 3 domain-containing protein n=1 Tax=Potamilus streckersoni TaxID=2493646 RepID=A0AAE0S1U8_9BIVA|nr:hypothetical protein CHS0354_026135 [Potamilus streckersoni]
MATSDPTEKVQDPKCKNWLRIVLALHYLKDGITAFVKEEIDTLHQSLLLKLYGGTSVPFPQCTFCRFQNMKQSRGTWMLFPPCPSGLCDAWLRELLELHVSFKRERAYDCDVTAWPFTPWECAKLYLHKGQNTANSGPDDCDTQAILNLITSCKRFHSKLPSQWQSLIQRVLNIRNIVMHSEDMKVTDSAREQYIQSITKLLTDPSHLRSLEACQKAVANIDMINNASVDVFFDLDVEVKALRECVKDVQQQLGVYRDKDNEKSIDALKEEFKKCQDELNIFKEKTREDIKNVCEDVEAQKKTIQSLDEKIDTKLQEQDAKCMQRGRTTVSQLLELVRSALAGQPNSQEMFTSLCSGYNDLGGRSTGLGEGTGIPDRRPESEGLKQLKRKTENNIDAKRCHEFISTEQSDIADKLLQQNKFLVIKGNPGEGKTTLAFHLIDKPKYINNRVVVNSLIDWKMVDTDWVNIVVFEDIFGQYDLDTGHLEEWKLHLRDIQNYIDAGKLEVIVSTRTDIYAKAMPKLESMRLFSDEFSVILSSDNLEDSEKMRLLTTKLTFRGRKMQNHEKLECISNFRGFLGFPFCCSLFADHERLFQERAKFFKHPVKLFFENIKQLELSRLLSLAFLFCVGEVSEALLSPETFPEWYRSLLTKLATYLQTANMKDANVLFLRKSYEDFSGLYVTKSKTHVKFSHATVYEAVGHALVKHCPEIVVQYCSSDFLYHRVCLETFDRNVTNVLCVPHYAFRSLAQRMINEIVEEKSVRNVAEHSAFRQQYFVSQFKEQLLECNKVREVLTMVCSDKQYVKELLHLGYTNTFLQHILRNDTETVKTVFDQLLEFLECDHTENTKTCWQCEEQQNLLEIALYYGNFETAEKLLALNADLSDISLCNAARHRNLKWVQRIVKSLKMSESFSPDMKMIRESLARAFILVDDNVINYLLNEGVRLDPVSIRGIVENGDGAAVQKAFQLLKYDVGFESFMCCSTLMLSTFMQQDTSFADILYKEGVQLSSLMNLPTTMLKRLFAFSFPVIEFIQGTSQINDDIMTMEALPCAVISGSSDSVHQFIQYLKDTNKWKITSVWAMFALISSFMYEIDDVCDLLVREGVSFDMRMLMVLYFSLLFVKSSKTELSHNFVTLIKIFFSAWFDKFPLELFDNNDAEMIQNIASVVLDGMLSFIPLLNGLEVNVIRIGLKLIERLKEIGTWDPKSPQATGILLFAFYMGNFDFCELLAQEGVFLAMKALPFILKVGTLDSVIKIIEHLKKYHILESSSLVASEAFANAYIKQMSSVCNLLSKEGVTLEMDILPQIVTNVESLDNVKKIINLLKDNNNWNPKSFYGSEALKLCFWQERHDVREFLIQEGASLSMEDFPHMVVKGSSESIIEVIKYLKEGNKWNPCSESAQKALGNAYWLAKYDIFDLLDEEGVS